MTPEERLNRVRSVLFPTPEDMGPRGSVDYSADENLDSAIIDLQIRGADKVCINTLTRIYWQLVAARKAIEGREPAA